uniref:(northern house mosquito) hypothetical protein n=1 Tax=Culex pipiens TaxID=7175 RepID=A0A8D8LEA8_CULPI
MDYQDCPVSRVNPVPEVIPVFEVTREKRVKVLVNRKTTTRVKRVNQATMVPKVCKDDKDHRVSEAPKDDQDSPVFLDPVAPKVTKVSRASASRVSRVKREKKVSKLDPSVEAKP